MRVLHIFSEIKFSGAEIMYSSAAAAFQSNGLEMIAVSTGGELGDFASQFESESIEVNHIKLPDSELLAFLFINHFIKFYRFIKVNDINVIHIHRSKHSFFFSILGFLTGVKTVRTVHNVFRHRKWTWIKGYLERRIASKVFKTTFQSIGESVYENELLYYKNKSIMIYNWYDGKRFYEETSGQEKKLIRKRLNVPLSTYVVISTGGCSNIKNHHDIIRALKIVNEKIDCLYLHLGEGVTTEEEKQLAIALGVDNKIRFLGNQKNVRDYLIASDVYLMPSRFEGLGNAAIEAMACAKPSVLYNVVGLKDLVNNNNNNCFLIPESYKELAEKILYLEANPKISAEMADIAAKFAKDKFSITKGVSQIMRLYKA